MIDKNQKPGSYQQDTVKQRDELTTQVVGIAAQRKKDLQGVILNPEEIAKSVSLMFTKLGVGENRIYEIRSYVEDGRFLISAVIELNAVIENSRPKTDALDELFMQARNTKIRIRSSIYNGLRNKGYYKELKFRKEKVKGVGDCIVFTFDAAMLLAFIYDINYEDPFYKCTPIEVLRLLDATDSLSKEKEKKIRKFCKRNRFIPYGAVLTYSTNKGGFHPSQVENMHRN
jgi:hypothetical protein